MASLKSSNSFPPTSSAASSKSSLMFTPPRAGTILVIPSKKPACEIK
uniref:Uncharacterized protein n=1 Tax=Rhizophora mucronata TaxID=61149 RepID=A0A2P2IWP6_RHIMU